jgi:type III pantothenate kinase
MKKRNRALLAIDAGNSTVGLGLFPDYTASQPLFTRKISMTGNITESMLRKEIAGLLSDASVAGAYRKAPREKIGAIISSVVPGLNRKILNALNQFCAKPIFADNISSGLEFKIPNPEKAGADRIVNAVAGFSMTGKPTAVVDFGTATTITIVGEHKTFMGGAILPGLDLMANALASGTAKLPRIDISIPEEALGSDTVSAIMSGIVFGTAGAALKIITSVEEETGLELSLIITGGRAGIVSPFLERPHSIVPDLIFAGLSLIYNAAQDS